MIREVYDLNEDERKAHQERWGDFNDAPPDWAEITEAEMIETTPLRAYTPQLVEYRQILPSRTNGAISAGPMLAATLYYFHDRTGVGMSFDYQQKKVRWFRFGCDHQMTTWWPVMFERHDKCEKCGYEAVYDTSG